MTRTMKHVSLIVLVMKRPRHERVRISVDVFPLGDGDITFRSD